MITTEWSSEKWGNDKDLMRGVESISISCEAKTETDSENNITKCTGRSLEKLSISFSTATSVGGDPIKEQKNLEKLAGTSAPFYCGEEQIGDNNFILESINLSGGLIDNKGRCLSATFELAFIEDAKEQELNGAKKNEATKKNSQPIKIIYSGENIAQKISIEKIYYTQYAANHADVLELHFNDTARNWSNWDDGKMKGQEITVEIGEIKSGKMYISSCTVEGGAFVLRALSVPLSYNTTHSKSWEKITLEELAKEIASNHGLNCKTYSTKNKKRKFIQQNNDGDFEFLQRRAELEGACFVIFNGVLNLYDEKKLENDTPGATIDLDEPKFTSCSPNDATDRIIKEYTVKNGRFNGTATTREGVETKTEAIDEPLESDNDALEIATARLRAVNKEARTIVIETDLRPAISAGSVVKLESSQKKNWAGAAFVYKLRHDLKKNKTKIWARKPLDY